MTTVRQWTGRESRALRQALRLSVRDFACSLGVAVRTVTRWEARGDHTTLRPDSQALLDTALTRADPDAQQRFSAVLAAAFPANVHTVAPGGPHDALASAAAGRSVEVRDLVPQLFLPDLPGPEIEDEDMQRRPSSRALWPPVSSAAVS